MYQSPLSSSFSPASLLAEWKQNVVLFDPNRPTDTTWNVDSFQVNLGPDTEIHSFSRAADLLFRYQLYPKSVMTFMSDFSIEERSLRTGDYILQKGVILPGLLSAVTLTQVISVIIEPARRGFTYFSTNHHFIEGEFTVALVRKADGAIVLMAHSVSRPDPKLPVILRWAARQYQKRAHRSAPEYISSLFKG